MGFLSLGNVIVPTPRENVHLKDRSILPNSNIYNFQHFVAFLFSDDTLLLGKGTNSLLCNSVQTFFFSLVEQQYLNFKHKIR